MKIVLPSLVLFSFLVYVFPVVKDLFISSSNIKKLQWKEIFNLSELNKDYVAQGIAYHNNLIFFTVHEKDKRSYILIFEEKNNTLYNLKQFVMPKEATHTSDLTFYKGSLYAVDYEATKIYKIDILKSISVDNLIVEDSVDINKKRTGSLEIIEYMGKEYLFITSFLYDNNLYVYDFNKFMNKEVDEPEIEIKNSYFVQGLYFDSIDNVLYQSVNKKGVDAIYKIDIEKLFITKKLADSIIETYNVPIDMVEDIFVRDGIIYASQEKSNKIYKADIK